jgi:hypothetical protein
MSNLQSAKAAIQAELSQAKAGMAYYQSRAEALEKTLAQLASINAPAESPAAAKEAKKLVPTVATGKPKKRAKKQLANKATGTAADTRSAKRVAELPFTGGDYWTNLLSDQPKSGPEILKSAINKLGFSPSKVQIQKLSGRMTFSLNTLVKAKKIQDSGSGRARRFFKI